MTVQKWYCTWPSCFQETALLPMAGLDGCIHFACPFHHDWILRDMEQHRGALVHMPVEERKNPNMSVDIVKHPWSAFCNEEKCYYVVAAKTYEEGVALLTNHDCPYTGGPTRIGLMMSRTKLDEAWLKLDVAVVELIEGNLAPEEKTRLVGVCRGMAELLAIFMQPHFDHPDQISAEAKKRYEAKKAGQDDYETPGLGGVRFAQPRTREWKEGINKSATPAQTKVNPADKFKPEEVKAIKAALDMGMMNEEELAKMYKVGVALIKQIVAST